jgi:hypothetical protein
LERCPINRIGPTSLVALREGYLFSGISVDSDCNDSRGGWLWITQFIYVNFSRANDREVSFPKWRLPHFRDWQVNGSGKLSQVGNSEDGGSN